MRKIGMNGNENIKHLVFGVCVAFLLLGAFVGGASATSWYVEEDPQINEEVFFHLLSDSDVSIAKDLSLTTILTKTKSNVFYI